jgi:hypothetical protein
MALNYPPEGWRDFLLEQLQVRVADCDNYEDYYRGIHPLAFATSKFKEAFGDLFAAFADNFMELVVDVPVDKLKLTGFDFGSLELNAEAWKLWRLYRMHVNSRIAHTEAVKCRTSFVLVDQVLKKFTIWHPKMAYVEVDPTDPTNRLAGIIQWVDVTGRTFCNVYLPDATYKYGSKMEGASPRPQVTLPDQERYPVTGGWELLDTIPNPLRVVNLIPLENNPTLLRGGKSDLDVVIPLQNGANKELADMFVASEFQAFKQRVLTGVEVPKYPEDYPDPALAGKPLASAELMAAISRTWFIESSEAKVTELGGTDLSNYVDVVEMLVQHIATKARIPPQHFLSAGATLANVNSESMTIINDGFVSKVERKQDDFGPAWVEAMRLLLQLKGKTVPSDVIGEAQWAPVMEPAISSIADALVKLDGLGVPREWAWRKIGATPEEVADWRKQLLARQARAAKQMQAQAPGLLGPDGAPLRPSQPQEAQTPSAVPNGPQTTPQAPHTG